MKKIFVNLICSFVPSKNTRRTIRAKLLPKKTIISYDKIDLCLSKLESLEGLVKKTINVNSVPEATGNLALIQKSSLAILAKFSEIMNRNNLKWWLDSGTLIGYIRHNGFVPWDDDIDVAVSREDYEKLPELLSDDFIKEGFFFRVGEITRLYYKNLMVWVDVFPMDRGYSEAPLIGKEYDDFIILLNKIKSNLNFDGSKWLQREQPVSDKYLQTCKKQRDKLLVKSSVSKGFIFYGVETAVKNRTLFKHDWIYPLKAVKFLGVDTFIPAETDYYLYLQYGDYLTWPNDFSSVHDNSYYKKMTFEDMKECKELIKKYLPNGCDDEKTKNR